MDVTNPRHFLDIWRDRLHDPEAFLPRRSYLAQVAGYDSSEAIADPHGARWSALRAVDEAAQELGFQGSLVAQIDAQAAERSIELGYGRLRPSAPALALKRTMTLEEVERRFNYVKQAEYNPWSTPHGPGKEHVWLEDRTKRLFQRYGRIYPDAVTFADGSRRCNFDLFMVSDEGRAITIEIMSGHWPGKYASKLKLASDFATRKTITIFIGSAPPGWREAPFPRTLWSEKHGLFVVESGWTPASEDASAAYNYRLGPEHPHAFYLTEPELCDIAGRPLIEMILAG